MSNHDLLTWAHRRSPEAPCPCADRGGWRGARVWFALGAGLVALSGLPGALGCDAASWDALAAATHDEDTGLDQDTGPGADVAGFNEDALADALVEVGPHGPAQDAAGSSDGGEEPDAGPAVPVEPPVSEELAAAFAQAVADHLADTASPGAVVGVRMPDGTWWEGGAGLACPEGDEGLAPGRRYRTGSVTKTFVAAATLQLVAEGALGLDDPVDDLVPGFDLGPGVTVRRLLNHTSGIFNPADDPLSVDGDVTQAIAPEDLVAMALEHDRVFPPGTGWDYSNTNYVLLGLVLEAVTGEPAAAVLRARLLGPWGLDDTYLEGAELPVGPLGPPEGPAEATDPALVCGTILGTEATYVMDMSWAWTAGAMVSTPLDLCDWAEALVLGEVVPQPLRDAMQAKTVLPDGHVVNYGFGLEHRTRGGRPVLGHSGSTWGFESEVYVDPASGLCVVGLVNAFRGEPSAVTGPVWDAAVGTTT